MFVPRARTTRSAQTASGGKTSVLQGAHATFVDQDFSSSPSVKLRQNPWPGFLWKDDAAAGFLRSHDGRFFFRELGEEELQEGSGLGAARGASVREPQQED